MKNILMIATGGTIASKPSDAGLTPVITSKEILGYVPAVEEFCKVDTLQLMNLDSTNITPNHWQRMVQTIRENYDTYDGFVLTHGTDTMAYTAAALSYLIQNSPKPIVITGSQKSIFLKDTDARLNLYNSFLYASSEGSHGVSLVFDGKVISGTRARKERTKSFNAFSSVDYPEIAVIRDGKLIRYLSNWNYDTQPTFFEKLEERIFLLTLIPGMNADILNQLKDSYEAVIIQSFGAGGLPIHVDDTFSRSIEEWISDGKTIIMMTQVPYEGSDMEAYQVGYMIKEKYRLIEAYNMTMEAVVTKLMWVLGQTKNPSEIRRLFYTPVQFDIIQ
ncbi:MAG TPA: asparaginase [Lachnospiraceae bacterium]|nr:asparaginase [Lachnospiraceae bacterium]